MKVRILCVTCANKWRDNPLTLANQDQEIAKALTATPLQNSSIYEVVCPQGHTSTLVLQNPKFELLFDSGISALKDGYYREAVSSFSVALERFYEYSIRILLSPIIDQITDDYSKTWKAMSKQSERQLGAFYMLYLNVIKRKALFFDSGFLKSQGIQLGIEGNDPVTFRNRVVHEGFIPTYKQAVAFGEAIDCYIRTLLTEFVNENLNISAPSHEDHEAAQLLVHAKKIPYSIAILPTFVSLNRAIVKESRESLIEHMKKSKVLYY